MHIPTGEGFLKCDACELGYEGNICHACQKNYYRYRGHCVPCFCSSMGDPDSEQICRRLTGECINCQGNTTGIALCLFVCLSGCPSVV